MKALRLSILLFFLITGFYSFGQDSVINKPMTDTAAITRPEVKIKKHSPKIATRRSLMLPGWGQAYNREYWKIPIIWGALGTCAGIWIYNNTWYHRTRDAYNIVFNKDTANFGNIHPKLKKSDGTPGDLNLLQTYRNTFRRDRDYSLLWFLATWALNAVDATVFAHLKNFDVSDDLSVEVKPNLNPTTRSAGFTLALNFK
jgi:hypothetical protein